MPDGLAGRESCGVPHGSYLPGITLQHLPLLQLHHLHVPGGVLSGDIRDADGGAVHHLLPPRLCPLGQEANNGLPASQETEGGQEKGGTTVSWSNNF